MENFELFYQDVTVVVQKLKKGGLYQHVTVLVQKQKTKKKKES